MPTFALRGNDEKKIYGVHGSRVEFLMQAWAKGPQPVSALPSWLVSAFDSMPEIQEIAINTENGGVIYRRI